MIGASGKRPGWAAYLALASLLAAPCAIAQEDIPITSVVVPVVGSTLGANGTIWKSDVELRNDFRTEVTVSLILPTLADQPAIIATIPPGESVRFADVVGEAFGLDAALGPMLVQTLGRRSVTVRAAAYGVRGAEVFDPQPFDIRYSDTWAPIRTLQGLSFNDDFRTNVGILNLGASDAVIVLALQRIPGRNLAVSRLSVPPNTLWHMPIQHVFPLITRGEGFSILVESSFRDTHVYASVVENKNNRGRFILPTVGALSAAGW